METEHKEINMIIESEKQLNPCIFCGGDCDAQRGISLRYDAMENEKIKSGWGHLNCYIKFCVDDYLKSK